MNHITKKIYLEDMKLPAIDAQILEMGEDETGSFVVPNITVTHAQGGGQPGDQGTIDTKDGRKVSIIDVRHAENGAVRLYVSECLEDNGSPIAVKISINEEIRNKHSLYHTAGHFLAAIVEKLTDFKAFKGHHFPGESRVEFRGEGEILSGFKDLLLTELNEVSSMGLPIAIVGDPYSNRTIKIGDFAPLPCGGTHIETTSELIDRFEIRGIKHKKGILRIGYDVVFAGHSAKQR